MFVFQLEWLEPDHERRNQIPCLGRENRHRYHFVDVASRLDVPDLLRVGQFVEGKLSFGLWIQLSNIRRVWWLDDSACAVEEPIKYGVQGSGRLLGRRFIAFH